MTRIFQIILVFIALAFSLSACGVRGGLESPSADKAAKSDSTEPGEEKPHKPFILDGLIR